VDNGCGSRIQNASANYKLDAVLRLYQGGEKRSAGPAFSRAKSQILILCADCSLAFRSLSQ
jgi:hypothetical protein